MENIIRKSIEGGYKDVTNTDDWQNRRDYVMQVTVLDPLFWQALGKACGWDKQFEIGKSVITPYGIGRVTSTENFKGGKVRVKFAEGGLTYFSWEEVVVYSKFDWWTTRALRFHEKNLTEGWEKAVEYLTSLVGKELEK